MFVARCRINFCNPQKWRILSDFCLKTAQNRGIFSAHCPFKSNKRSHSGDNGDEDPPVPIPNTEVKLVYSKVREDSKLPDFKKGAITTKLWLRSFFATCYPTGEGEQGLLKIADTRYFALRGEPTTKYSGWWCPSLPSIHYGKRESKLPDFIKKRPFSTESGRFSYDFNRFR